MALEDEGLAAGNKMWQMYLGEDDKMIGNGHFATIYRIFNLCKIYVMYTVLHVYLVCLLNFRSGTV